MHPVVSSSALAIERCSPAVHTVWSSRLSGVDSLSNLVAWLPVLCDPCNRWWLAGVPIPAMRPHFGHCLCVCATCCSRIDDQPLIDLTWPGSSEMLTSLFDHEQIL
jgi:hypothetical protein